MSVVIIINIMEWLKKSINNKILEPYIFQIEFIVKQELQFFVFIIIECELPHSKDLHTFKHCIHLIHNVNNRIKQPNTVLRIIFLHVQMRN
jgi:hypothetical protein